MVSKVVWCKGREWVGEEEEEEEEEEEADICRTRAPPCLLRIVSGSER
jgi:hypothetical protein